jgi:hypothetical protein
MLLNLLTADDPLEVYPAVSSKGNHIPLSAPGALWRTHFIPLTGPGYPRSTPSNLVLVIPFQQFVTATAAGATTRSLRIATPDTPYSMVMNFHSFAIRNMPTFCTMKNSPSFQRHKKGQCVQMDVLWTGISLTYEKARRQK